MFERFIIYLCITLFLISNIFLFSCSTARTAIPNAIEGRWEHAGHVFEYRKNGKLIYDDEVMEYNVVDDDTIHVKRNDGTDRQYTFDYTFNPDGTLTINKVKYFPVI